MTTRMRHAGLDVHAETITDVPAVNVHCDVMAPTLIPTNPGDR
jgi:hypothetical protein